MLTKEEKERYDRHLILNEIGESGQEKLKSASVLIVGLGGLGAPASTYLTGAGVGTIGLIDNDNVDLSNLQRQVLYNVDDIDKNKAECAKNKLSKQNPNVNFILHKGFLDANNAEEIVSNYDIVIVAVDNATTRVLIDKVCKKFSIPQIHGSISEYEGQVMVLNLDGGKSYLDVFPDAGKLIKQKWGVFVTLPGIIGAMQANEAVKIICGVGTVLKNKLMIYNALDCSVQVLELA